MDSKNSSPLFQDTIGLSAKLLELIDQVSNATSEQQATIILLHSLLVMFDMDQAVLVEIDSSNMTIKNQFGIDSTKRILKTAWISKTLLEQAITTSQPAVHRTELSTEDEIPKSVSEHSLKNLVCVPVSENEVISLASQRNPFRVYSTDELQRFKVAACAAVLGLKHVKSVRTLSEDNAKLRQALENRGHTPIYISRRMEQLIDEVQKLAPFNISILIQGESGVGKEVFAKEIHRLSQRKGKFIAVNCANLTETLLESELFGFVKGAFTGAAQGKKGLFQEADGGTLFLDEIAELSLNLQAKLLRVLQEKTIRPLGANSEIEVDVRVLSASHTNLSSAIGEKTFREDLYYRIQEMTVTIPALRERPEDIEVLAQHFITQFIQEFKLTPRYFSEEALIRLRSYSWPGNIRELKNICRTAVILSNDVQISVDHVRLPKTATGTIPQIPNNLPSLRDATGKYEIELIKKLLDEPGQTQATVAEKLHVSKRTLQRILARDTSL